MSQLAVIKIKLHNQFFQFALIILADPFIIMLHSSFKGVIRPSFTSMLVIIFNILMYLGNFKVQERYLLPRRLFIIKTCKNIYAFPLEKVGAIISFYIHFIVLVMCALRVWLIMVTEFENYKGTWQQYILCFDHIIT